MKNKMREALENPSEPNNIKRTTDDPAVFEQKQLDDFVSSDTKVFFFILRLLCSFLESYAENWEFWNIWKHVKQLKI